MPLPKNIVPYSSIDKRLVEEWDEKRLRDIANFPSPFRALFIGPPHCGKTCMMKNFIIHQRPRFDQVFVITEESTEGTGGGEWLDLDPTMILSEVPDLGFWNSIIEDDDEEKRPQKRLVILDDVEMKGVSKERLRNIATLMRYISSHKGFSIMIGHQDFFGLDPIVKKTANIFCVWKPHARNEASLIDNRTGLPKGTLKHLFNTIATKPNDFITIDLTKNSPAPARLGLWTPIDIEE